MTSEVMWVQSPVPQGTSFGCEAVLRRETDRYLQRATGRCALVEKGMRYRL